MTPIGMGMKSPRRPPRERPSEELLASKYTTPCFFAGFDRDERCPRCGGAPEGPRAFDLTGPCCHPFHFDCEGPMDLMHWIPARRLRAARVPVWDPRVVAVACRRHHLALDNYFLRIPRDQLPPAVEEYAREHDLLWSLNRDYR